MDLYKKCKVQPIPKHRYLVLEDIEFKDVTVPAGFLTNGADIPRLFWIIIPPNDSNILPAVIIHDYLCTTKDFDKADKFFELALSECRINRVKEFVLVSAVKLYTKTIRKALAWLKS